MQYCSRYCAILSRSRDRRTEVTKDQPYAQFESVKLVSDVYAPSSAEIIGVNDALNSAPETVNQDSCGQGWLVKVKLSDPLRSIR